MSAYRTIRSLASTTIFAIMILNPLHADTIDYQLTIAQEEMNFTGTSNTAWGLAFRFASDAWDTIPAQRPVGGHVPLPLDRYPWGGLVHNNFADENGGIS